MEKVILTNMCMIINNESNEVIVQERIKNWKGISFPGGHVELGESIVKSTIREVKEETGLDVSDLELCGIKNWYDFDKEERYVVFLYKTSKYQGELLEQTEEGKVYWVKLSDIKDMQLSYDFIDMLKIYESNNGISEFFYKDTRNNDENKRWDKKLY